jgi:ATP-dependent helicase/nuclease subunit B
MGMLESRVLDFETVIISSVNEGILPAGKANNSFIPYDVKRENNLPTYKEKDAGLYIPFL